MTDEIHPNWYVVKAMKCGFLVHCGELQLGIRNMQLDIFEAESEPYNIMLCTSTLLEGVNTSTENIIITKPCRSYGHNYSNDFEAFDFFNLVGRSGRLFKTNLGKAFYIKSPADKSFSLNDAIKSIEFEITSDSVDVKIQKKECADKEYQAFLKTLGCAEEEYLSVIGYTRLEKVQKLYHSYKEHKSYLLASIDNLINNPQSVSRASVIYRLLLIFNLESSGKYNGYLNYRAGIINLVINKNRYKIRQIVGKIWDNSDVSKKTLS
jgi:replicative superfamily II helicase